MKVNKKQGLLYIFNLLKDQQPIKKQNIMESLEIEEHSFWRYLQEIRAFVSNFYLPYELIYKRSTGEYLLISTK